MSGSQSVALATEEGDMIVENLLDRVRDKI